MGRGNSFIDERRRGCDRPPEPLLKGCVMKTCTKCGKTYPATPEYFNRAKADKSGLHSWCKECRIADHKEYNRSEKGRLASRRNDTTPARRLYKRLRHIKRSYGVTLEQYDQMCEQQGGVCAICGSVDPNGRRLAVDHDHKTGKVRGLLCSRCNLGAGFIEDDVFVSKALFYLRGHRWSG